MQAFIVFRDANYHGDTITREVIGVYDSLEKAQSAIQTEIVELLKEKVYTVNYINEKNTFLYVDEGTNVSEDTISLYIEIYNIY